MRVWFREQIAEMVSHARSYARCNGVTLILVTGKIEGFGVYTIGDNWAKEYYGNPPTAAIIARDGKLTVLPGYESVFADVTDQTVGTAGGATLADSSAAATSAAFSKAGKAAKNPA